MVAFLVRCHSLEMLPIPRQISARVATETEVPALDTPANTSWRPAILAFLLQLSERYSVPGLRTYFKVPTDMAWGTLENGSWNGMVKMVHSNQVDIAISEFTMTKNRLDVVDYTMPLLFKRIFVRASNDAKYSEWGNFVAPFSPSLWLTLGVFIVGISAYFHVLHAIRMHMCDSETRVPRRYCPYKSVFHVLGAFCQQGQGITPRSSSCRIALLFTLLTAVLTLSTYSGSFISNLSIPITKFPYDNLEQMLNQGNYTFAVLRQSAEYDQFETSKVRFLKDVYRIHLAPHKDDLPTTDLSAIQRLCQRNKYSVLISMDLAEGLMDQVGCTVVPLAKEIFPATLAMIVTKSSPYLGIINYQSAQLLIATESRIVLAHHSEAAIRHPAASLCAIFSSGPCPRSFRSSKPIKE
uniref:(California timema) hypothetical protein n=1 Tax=Timema californicum TaxID=61474 RepID=A0A7R9JAF1_TIMCA|nr:unnamed protein product [Timema californicum]